MEKDLISVVIDDIEVKVKKGTTILEAAKKIGIDIPTLCFLKEINEVGDCRICLVEVKGFRGFVTACMQKVEDGMIVYTNTSRVHDARKNVLKLILSSHEKKCLSCIRNGNCELQSLALKFGIDDIEFEGQLPKKNVDDKSVSIVRDTQKCILCRRCISTCKNIQKVGAIDCVNRGFESAISTYDNKSLADVNCTFCGQCIQNCPTASLHEKENINDVYEALNNEKKYVIVQTAPAVRAALGEEFGIKIGTNVEGKMITALKRMGFDKVFDTNTGADFTVVEEATEFINRIKNNERLPLITSCCPAWIRFVEMEYPELLKYVSTCKSPHEMLGSIIKTFYANKIGLNPKDICVVSIMPCVGKKFERQREELKSDDLYDVDIVITTRELAKMIRQFNINFESLEDSKFDDPMGEATGASSIFGVTGGVMEAALRTTQDYLTNEYLDKIDFKEIRGKQGIKKACINIGNRNFNIVSASGLGNARELMEEIKSGKVNYDFIEIMACPGGCIMGGGQPIQSSKIRSEVDIKNLRAKCLYDTDKQKIIRKSHQNPVLKSIYEQYFEHPNSKLAHKYLHINLINE